MSKIYVRSRRTNTTRDVYYNLYRSNDIRRENKLIYLFICFFNYKNIIRCFTLILKQLFTRSYDRYVTSLFTRLNLNLNVNKSYRLNLGFGKLDPK